MIRATAAFAVAIALAGCGQKGPLRLADPPKNPVPEAAPVAAPPPAPAPPVPTPPPKQESENKS